MCVIEVFGTFHNSGHTASYLEVGGSNCGLLKSVGNTAANFPGEDPSQLWMAAHGAVALSFMFCLLATRACLKTAGAQATRCRCSA